MNIRPGHEWEPFEGLSTPPDRVRGRQSSKHMVTSYRLVACFARVLNVTGFLIHLALGPIPFAFGLHLLVASHLTEGVLHGAFGLLERALYVLVHIPSPGGICPSHKTLAI